MVAEDNTQAQREHVAWQVTTGPSDKDHVNQFGLCGTPPSAQLRNPEPC